MNKNNHFYFQKFKQIIIFFVIINFVSCGEEINLLQDTLNKKSSLTEQQLKNVKNQIISIAKRNNKNIEGISETREQLNPLIEILAEHFANNRPENELALTGGTWQSIWYDDKDIEASERFQSLNREKIFQLVYTNGTGPSFYYNVSESRVKIFGIKTLKVRTFLRGNYTLDQISTPETLGERQRNVINLEFAENRMQLKRLRYGTSIQEITEDVIRGNSRTYKIPGPKGIKGKLFNLYVDEDIRISGGFQENDEDLDLYILLKNDEVKPFSEL